MHRNSESNQAERSTTIGDLYIAAYLVAQGFKFPAILPDGPRRRFVFDSQGQDLRALLQTLHRGEASVNALTFIRVLKELKTAIHNNF